MIELFYWPTPNGHKITIFLEEAELPYKLKLINIREGEQFDPAFLKTSPNNKIPAIIDTNPKTGSDPINVFESGAILLYLAEKTNLFLPSNLPEKYNTLQWLFWQVSGLGPMAGQNHHFTQYADQKVPYAIERYVKETARLYAVLNKQLEDKNFIGGDYSIADMACYPWILLHEQQQQNINEFPNIKRWCNTISERPAVKRAYALKDNISIPPMSENAKKILFNQDGKTVSR